MLFSSKSSLLLAVLTLGSALVRAQFQAGTYRILNSEGQTTFVTPGHDGELAIPLVVSKNFPQGPASTWDIAPASVGSDEYVIKTTQFGLFVADSQSGGLRTAGKSNNWKLKTLSNGFYAIQHSDNRETWTSTGTKGEDKAVFLIEEDPADSGQRFTFVESNNEN